MWKEKDFACKNKQKWNLKKKAREANQEEDRSAV